MSINKHRDIFWLDGQDWEFRIEGENKWQFGITIPSCWNFISGLANYEGVAYYRKYFTITENWSEKIIFLHFRAVNYYCEVYLNDDYIGMHEGGYTPFKFNITNSIILNETNNLFIKVSNILSPETIPGSIIGWKNYGGIYREVYLESTNTTYIESNFIHQEIEIGNINNATLSHNLTLINSKNNSKAINCTIRISDFTSNEISSMNYTFNIPSYHLKNILLTQKCVNISLWSPNFPKMYDIFVLIYENNTLNILDKMDYTIGFREIEIKNATLYLNDEKFTIKGINRHEDFPEWGKTQPYDLMKRDLDLLRELNINSIRTFHYPNHPAFIELCDQYGFFIIEEIPAWNIPASDLTRNKVVQISKKQIEEMIKRDYNHPCILFWGVRNEISSDTLAGRNFIQEMVKTVKSLDNETPTYFASNNLDDDICFDLVDIIAGNPKYGWYYDEISDLDGYLEYWHDKYPDKPILITEFSAGAEIGDYSGQKYSENYQAYLIKESWSIVISKNYTIGGYISCFMDYPDLQRMLNPTPFFNQKGLLSYDRNYAKLAFNVTKGIFNETPYDFPVAIDNSPIFFPLPKLYFILIITIIILECTFIFIYFRTKEGRSRPEIRDFLKLKPYRRFGKIDLFLSTKTFIALILTSTIVINLFLETTTLSMPVFTIEEKIIFRYLITDGIYFFLPYLLLYYFCFVSLLIYLFARIFKINCKFNTIFFTHLKTNWLFFFTLPIISLTIFGFIPILIIYMILFLIKIVLDMIIIKRALKTSRIKAIILKLIPILIIIFSFIIYLHIRFDIFNLIILLL
jgi:beta-glucuronidase